MFPILFQIFKTSPGGNVNDSVRTKLAPWREYLGGVMGACHKLPVFTRKILICAPSALTLCQVNVRRKGPFSNTNLLNLKLTKE